MGGLPEPPRRRFYFWIGLAVITLLYCLYYIGFIYGLARRIPLRASHFVKFCFILFSYAAGAYALKKQGIPWMVRIWNGLYVLVLVGLLSLGLYDWGIGRVPLSVRIVADDLQEFLVSPILYVAMGIIGRRITEMV